MEQDALAAMVALPTHTLILMGFTVAAITAAAVFIIAMFIE